MNKYVLTFLIGMFFGCALFITIHRCPRCYYCKDLTNKLVEANNKIEFANHLLRNENVILINQRYYKQKPKTKQIYEYDQDTINLSSN